MEQMPTRPLDQHTMLHDKRQQYRRHELKMTLSNGGFIGMTADCRYKKI